MSVSGNRVKAQVPRTIYYVVLGIALILAAATLSIVLPSHAYAASPAFVQGRATQVTSGTTASLAFSKANTAGNLIVVYVVWDNSGTVTVSDTRGDTYTAATARQTWGNNWSAQVFYAPDIVGGSNTVKATFGTAITSFGLVYLHEYSGLATALPVDVSASAAGTSASMSSGAVTTSQANDLLFAAGASDNTVTQGTGFTTRLTDFGNLTEDRIVTTTGSYAGTASQNGSTWVMQLVAFRAASGATGPPTKLAFVQGPSNTAAGAAITPAVTVAVEDANGNVETTDNATTVSLAIGTNPGRRDAQRRLGRHGGLGHRHLLGPLHQQGRDRLHADGLEHALVHRGHLGRLQHHAGVGPPTKLAFVQGPSNTAAGAAITPAVKVAVEDANGNVETSDNATTVSLAIGTNPGGGTLSGGSAVTVATGIATFSGLSINTAGTGYTLTASSTPSYTAATSAAFNITAGDRPTHQAGLRPGSLQRRRRAPPSPRP